MRDNSSGVGPSEIFFGVVVVLEQTHVRIVKNFICGVLRNEWDDPHGHGSRIP